MKKKILLVDDVRLFLKLEETFFKRTGCEIITAESGAEAISLARENGPDLILLDYIMPDLMGDEVCKRLKSSDATRAIPIMIVSTSADAGDIEKCFAAGADDYVTKPINAQEVLAKAANILNIPHRVHYRAPVTFRVEGQSSGQAFSGTTRNLSQGGLLLECKDPIAPEATVSLDLALRPGQEPIHLYGQVVRNEQDQATGLYLIGIRFSSLASEHQKSITEVLNLYPSRPLML